MRHARCFFDEAMGRASYLKESPNATCILNAVEKGLVKQMVNRSLRKKMYPLLISTRIPVPQ